MSLDVLRAIAKSKGQVLQAFFNRIEEILDACKNSSLSESSTLLEQRRLQLISFATKYPEQLEYVARDFAFGLARTLAGALLLEHASWNGATDSDLAAAQRWLKQRDLIAQSLIDTKSNETNRNTQSLDDALVYDGYDSKHILSPLF